MEKFIIEPVIYGSVGFPIDNNKYYKEGKVEVCHQSLPLYKL